MIFFILFRKTIKKYYNFFIDRKKSLHIFFYFWKAHKSQMSLAWLERRNFFGLTLVGQYFFWGFDNVIFAWIKVAYVHDMTWSLPVLDNVYCNGETKARQEVLGAGQGEAAGVAEELPRPGGEGVQVREWLVCTFQWSCIYKLNMNPIIN